jgi:hypothetical protein
LGFKDLAKNGSRTTCTSELNFLTGMTKKELLPYRHRGFAVKDLAKKLPPPTCTPDLWSKHSGQERNSTKERILPICTPDLGWIATPKHVTVGCHGNHAPEKGVGALEPDIETLRGERRLPGKLRKYLQENN